MATIPEIARAMRLILTEKADELAHSNRFVRRRDKPLTGALFVQTLVFTLLGTPTPSLTDYCQTAAARGRPISEQGFDQNFTAPAADLLLGLLQLAAAVAIAAADPVAAGLLTRFSAVLLFDSSCIALPARLAPLWRGCGAAGVPAAANAATLKLALGLELLRGQLLGLELLDGCVHDQLSRVPHTALPAQALRLADLGFFNLARFAAVAAADGCWFSRLRTGTLVVTADGQQGEVDALLAAQEGNQYDGWVEVGAMRLPARLIAVRVSQEVADNRRRRLRAAAQAKGRAVSARRLAGAGWNVYICNIPAEQLSVEEAVVLAGVRWQIELLFKLWKSHGQIDTWAASGNEWRVLCEIYGKLIAMVVRHWVIVVSCWANPARSLGAAARVVRQYATALVSSWADERHVVSTLELMQRVIQATCQMGKRKKQPSTYQLLLNPELVTTTGGLA
jgi:Transposase DDE domain